VGTVIPKAVLLLVALAYGGVVVANGVSEMLRGKPLTPKPGRLVSGRAVRTADVLASGVLGFTLSLTLLPCSGGPLLAFIYAASVEGLSTIKIALLLLLYNAIFILPLVAIAAAFTLSGKLLSTKLPSRLYPALEVVAGILVIVIVLVAT
jgi:cytochrome c biogenesis protein CcdA